MLQWRSLEVKGSSWEEIGPPIALSCKASHKLMPHFRIFKPVTTASMHLITIFGERLTEVAFLTIPTAIHEFVSKSG